MALYSYPNVGRTGLANMLYPWARAVIFARDNSCPVIAPQWTKVNRMGPWLRGEPDKRYYFHQFSNKGYITGVSKMLLLATQKKHSEDSFNNGKGIVVFKGLRNYLKDFTKESSYLRGELFKIVRSEIIARVNAIENDFAAIHIRRGDFAAWGTLLPFDYYIRGIALAKKLGYSDDSIWVFTDSPEDVRKAIGHMVGARIMPSAPAIQDLLLMSKARLLIGTNRSTFSEWAAFLGGMHSVWSCNAPVAEGLNDYEVL